MLDDFYSLQSDDIAIVQGDTVNLEYEFTDEDGNDIDITACDAKFTVRDPETDEVIPMIPTITAWSKEHNDNLLGGRGIYFFGDTQIAGSSAVLTKNSQLIIILDYSDTALLEYGIAYPFDIELSRYGVGGIKVTAVRGHILVAKEQTQ